MKLLLIDYISFLGHRNFNKIHIEALQSIGHELTLLGKKGQFDNITINENMKVLEMPKRYFRKYPYPAVSFRLQGIGALLWVKTHTRLKEYDAIIILTYDILSLFVFRTSVPVYLIDHNNVSQLWSKLKLSLTRCLPANYMHIALNRDMEKRLQELLPRKHVFHIPHGLCPPSTDMKKPSFVSENERYLFCPVNRNYDASFIKFVFESPLLGTYLRDNNLKLYIKDQLGLKCNEVIEIVPQNMEIKQYNYMLQHAMAVLLPYGKDFKYRCSGIFFECVSRNTPVITTRLDSMAEYENEVEMKMFSTVQELISSIDSFQKTRNRIVCLEKFEPMKYWDICLSALRY